MIKFNYIHVLLIPLTLFYIFYSSYSSVLIPVVAVCIYVFGILKIKWDIKDDVILAFFYMFFSLFLLVFVKFHYANQAILWFYIFMIIATVRSIILL